MKTCLLTFTLVGAPLFVFAQITLSGNPAPKLCACELEGMRIQYEWNVGAGEGCISGKAYNAVIKTYNAPGPGVRALVSIKEADPKEVQKICSEKDEYQPAKKATKPTNPQ